MKIKLLIASSFFFVAPIFATSIPLPYNTGESSTNTVLAGGSVDTHWTAWNGPTIYVAGAPNAAWAVPTTTAAWVTVDPNNGASLNKGSYTENYFVTFNLTGFDPTAVELTGLFAADDELNNIYVNGISTGIFSPYSWSTLQAFTLEQYFVSGNNTIDFNFTNVQGAGGILVEFTSASTTPEPASYALVGLGMAGLALVRKKVSK